MNKTTKTLLIVSAVVGVIYLGLLSPASNGYGYRYADDDNYRRSVSSGSSFFFFWMGSSYNRGYGGSSSRSSSVRGSSVRGRGPSGGK